jgi:hypothetical protein
LQIERIYARKHDVDIDPIEQRPAKPSAVGSNSIGATEAAVGAVAAVSARTWVGRGHEHRTGRKARGSTDPRDRDGAVFERLPKRFERRPAQLGQLVEEQNAVMGEADFAGANGIAATDERDVADRVMGRPKWSLTEQMRLRANEPRHTVDDHHFEPFLT